jgi:hypothetical protein
MRIAALFISRAGQELHYGGTEPRRNHENGSLRVCCASVVRSGYCFILSAIVTTQPSGSSKANSRMP